MQQLVKACGCRCFSAALNAACHCELFCISVHSHPNLNFLCLVVRSLEIFYLKKKKKTFKTSQSFILLWKYGNITDNKEFGLKFFKTSQRSLFNNLLFKKESVCIK